MNATTCELQPRSTRATRTTRRPNVDAPADFTAAPCRREHTRTTPAPLRSAPLMPAPLRNPRAMLTNRFFLRRPQLAPRTPSDGFRCILVSVQSILCIYI
jgi:hypothetical protein